MPLELTQSWMLLGLLVLPVVVWYFYRGLTDFSKWQRAALRGGVPIDTVPLPSRAEPEVQLSAVNVPAQVREGEPFNVEVVISSNHADEGYVELFHGAHKVMFDFEGKKVDRYPVKVGPGETVKRFQQQITRDRMAEFTVRIGGCKADKLLDNTTARGLVYTNGKPRVLLVDSDPRQAKQLAFALEQEGIQVDIRPSQGIPDTIPDLQNYELPIISNVPATAMSVRQMNNIRTYVQDLGGGLIMLGGD